MIKICSLLLLALTFLPLRWASAANYYECTDKKGNIHISNVSCPDDSIQKSKFGLRESTQEEIDSYTQQESNKESEDLMEMLHEQEKEYIKADASEDPKVNVKVNYYHIKGDTAGELRREMISKYPDQISYKRAIGSVASMVRWSYKTKETRTICRITKVTTSVDITYTMPKWINYNTANKKLQEWWIKRYALLLEHENDHVDYYVEGAKQIRKRLLNMRRRNCNILNRDAYNLGNKISQRAAKESKGYDIQTNHGIRYPRLR